MYWIVILDYGNRRELCPVHSAEFAANLIANNWKAIAKARGDRIQVTVITNNKLKAGRC